MYCPHCMKFINEADPEICPNCGVNLKKKPVYKRWWFIAIVVYLILCVVAAFLPAKNTKINYVVMAESIVEDALKSPKTAEFCSPSECFVGIDEVDAYTYVIVDGYVDSQNSFGAFVRSDYTVEMIVREDKYKMLYMEIGDNEYGEYVSADFTYLYD